jgi:hypothetical protein
MSGVFRVTKKIPERTEETIDWDKLHQAIWDIATETERMVLNSMGYQKVNFTQAEKASLKKISSLLNDARMVIYHSKIEPIKPEIYRGDRKW